MRTGSADNGFFLLIGFLILIQIGCDRASNQNSNIAVNNNSAVTNRSPGATASSTPASQNGDWSFQRSDATGTVEKFIADAEKGDIDAMEKNYSKEYVKQKGAKLKSLAKSYSDLIRGFDPKEKPVIFGMRQKAKADKVIVEFNYGIAKNGVAAGKSTGCTAFELVKEDGEWKINDSPFCE